MATPSGKAASAQRLSRLRRLGEALLSVAEWPAFADLLLPPDRDWDADCPCLVVDDDRYVGTNPQIGYAGVNYAYAMDQEQVAGILAHCRSQLAREPSETEVVRAFMHYHQNDAYLQFGPAA